MHNLYHTKKQKNDLWKGMEVATISAGLFDGGKEVGFESYSNDNKKICFSLLFVFLACRFK